MSKKFITTQKETEEGNFFIISADWLKDDIRIKLKKGFKMMDILDVSNAEFKLE